MGNLPFKGTIHNAIKNKNELGVLYDQFSSIPLLKVGEILKLLEALYKTSENSELIKNLNIHLLKDKFFKVLSKGERKKIGLYASLFFKPKLLILDEPTDGLDPEFRDFFWNFIKNNKQTLLITTHLWEEVSSISDKILFIEKGKILNKPLSYSELLDKVKVKGKVIIEKTIQNYEMKKIIILSFFLTLFIGSYAQKNNSFTILSSAQKEIDKAFIKSFQKDTILFLQQKELLLNKIVSENSKTLDYYKKYWLSYIKYKKAIFYFKSGKKEKVKVEISKSIKFLEDIKNKNSEIYSLLALQQSFNFQFVPKQNFMIYLNKITENMEKSISLNPKNLRAYYVNANYDFYTPEEYGGGRKAEKMLLKAISLNDKSENSSFSPSWGKELSFDLLIQLYLKKKNLKAAKKQYQQAIKLYPKSILLSKYKKTLYK